MTSTKQQIAQIIGVLCGLFAITMRYYSKDTTTAEVLVIAGLVLMLCFRKAPR